MAELGIIHSGESIPALMAGTKTMTRRLLNPQPKHMVVRGRQERPGERCKWYDADCINPGVEIRCRYRAGDVLWVREKFRARDLFDKTGRAPEYHFMARVEYAAGGTVHEIPVDSDNWRCWLETDLVRWRSPAMMPRWASRITLSLVSVRVERLQAITEEDARAEGCDSIEDVSWSAYDTTTEGYPTFFADPTGKPGIVEVHKHVAATPARDVFVRRWDALNGKRAPWASNPFVWVLETKLLEVRK